MYVPEILIYEKYNSRNILFLLITPSFWSYVNGIRIIRVRVEISSFSQAFGQLNKCSSTVVQTNLTKIDYV